jgi:hypothetical protein
LIAWPVRTAFGRVVPKSKLHERHPASTKLKALLTEQVAQIVWQHKLSPETTNLPATEEVSEIQVLSLHLKTPELHRDVLRYIENAIPHPLIFELHADGRTQLTAALKSFDETDPARWELSGYFASDWVPSDSPRTAMPVALHLGGLYEQLLCRLIPLPARPHETIADLVDRVELIQAMQRDIDRNTATMAKERQFNRKVEINSVVRQLKATIERLTS